ncbi:tetratricopeptide repeat protein [Streptomyces milbemycinicus]|uniref:Tetratricopeptide repeat protein n=1 Tax=Streptomyces milbemycinicus TaxID=476552 RepID=A0ABW8LWB6_9ACTN
MSGTHNEFSGTAHHVVQAGSVGSVHFHGQPSAVQALDSLPPRHRPLVGRDAELTAALRALEPRSERTGLAVIGSPGVGKTALALEAAHRAVAERRFRGGVLYADLGTRGAERSPTTEELLGELLRMLGIPGDQLPTHRIGLTALLRTELVRQGERRGAVLVVLDNASDDTQLAACLPPEGTHRLLVTSRMPLEAPGTAVLRLTPLSAEDARTVLGLPGTVPNAELDEVARLCGRLPLALSIAAARLREDQEAGAGLLLAALRTESTRLAELGLEPAFDVSYHALPPADARLFRLLGLHPGTFLDAASAAALSGRPESETGPALRRLRRAHLLEPGDAHGRVRFHDLTRLYARERLADEPEPERRAALDRFLTHCAQRAAGADDEWLAQERRMLASAVDAAVGAGLYERVEPLAAPLARFLVRQARTVEALRLLREMVIAAQSQRDLAGEADLFLTMGGQYAALDDDERAWVCLRAYYRLQTRRGVSATFAHEQLGTVALNREDYKSAARHFRRAVKASNRLGDQRRLAVALDHLGEVHAHLGRDAEALHMFQRALAAAHEAAAPDAACLVHIDLAKLAQGYGSWPLPRDAEGEPPPDWESARFHTSQALDMAHRSGDVRVVIGALIASSVALNGAGDGEQAITTTRRAAGLAREHRLPHAEMAALVQESSILEGLGRDDEARERLAAAEALEDGAGTGGLPPGIPEPPPPSPARLDRHVVLRSLLFPAFGVVIALAAIALRGWSWLWGGYGVLMTAALWGHYDQAVKPTVEGFWGRAKEILWGLALLAAVWVACVAVFVETALDAVLWWCVAGSIPFAHLWLKSVWQRREELRVSHLPGDI